MEDYTTYQGAIQDKVAQVLSFRADSTVDGIRTRQRLYVCHQSERNVSL
jgi:hypothetical protein